MDDLDFETLVLLWAARRTGLLEALLADADTPAEVAAAAGVSERAAALTVETLLAEGFLARVGEACEPTNRLLGFLAAADLRSVGTLPDALDAVDALVALPETMRADDGGGDPSAEPAGTTSAERSGGDRRHRLGARAALDDATVRAAVTAAVRAAPDAGRVLDVGGAPGPFAAEFAARGREVTVVDRPGAVEAARPLLAREPVDVAAVEPGEPFPAEFDLAFAADVASRRPAAAGRELVERMADALADGGAVVLVDRLWERSAGAVPAAVEAFARDGGRVHREADFAAWFEAAGLGTPAVEAVPGTDRYAVAGRRETGRSHTIQ